MGVTAETAPSAFCVLRDAEYKTIEWTGSNGVRSGQSDWQGDFNFFMRGDYPGAEIVVGYGPVEAIEHRQCRKVMGERFAIDVGFAAPPYTLKVRALSGPGRGNLSVEYTDGVANQSLSLEASVDAWKTLEFTLTQRNFNLAHSTGAYVHMLEAIPGAIEPPPPPPPPPLPKPDWVEMLAMIEDIKSRLVIAEQARSDVMAIAAEVGRHLEEVSTKVEGLKVEMNKWSGEL
jgi:hypothetical protein